MFASTGVIANETTGTSLKSSDLAGAIDKVTVSRAQAST